MKEKKPFYKKWWFWVIIVVIVVAAVAGTGESGSESNSLRQNQNDSSNVSNESISQNNELREALKTKIDSSLLFDTSIRNDKTDNWRLARLATNLPITDYALDYYEAYFDNDNEVHAVINFTKNETNNITAGNGMLFIDTHQYVKDEEHDASELFGGPIIAQYIIDLNSGEIEIL